jgi:hypothetical protein
MPYICHPTHRALGIAKLPIGTLRPVENIYGNFLLLRPYHGEHGPEVPVTPEYIVLQRVAAAKTGVYVNPN